MNQQTNPAVLNMEARRAVSAYATKRRQSIYSQTIDPSSQRRVRIPIAATGLLLGLIINVKTNVAVAASTGTALTRTPFGAANLLEQVTFFDINNNTRHQTTGWHLAAIASARAGRPYAGTDLDAGSSAKNYPSFYGRVNEDLEAGAATIAQDADSDVAFTYMLPIAYSDKDLRGAIYAGVINATMTLQLDLNQDFIQARTLGGWSEAGYATANDSTAPADVTLGDFEIEVIQVYYDQLPGGKNPVLPALDLSVVYELKSTNYTGLTQGIGFDMPYSNFRDYLSTMTVYRNRVDASGFMTAGDIDKWALETASFLDIFELRDRYPAMWNREQFGSDLPLGVNMFSTREKPITTEQFGNMDLVVTPANVQTGANVLVGYETFALTDKVIRAASMGNS